MSTFKRKHCLVNITSDVDLCLHAKYNLQPFVNKAPGVVFTTIKLVYKCSPAQEY